mgnify:CR=1 FL=1
MKITKTKLKQIIKEEFATAISEQNLSEGFFDDAEQTDKDTESKLGFRKFRDDTLSLLEALKYMQNNSSDFDKVIAHVNSEKEFMNKQMYSKWKQKHATLIRALEKNLEQLTGKKGTHSGAKPLAERLDGHSPPWPSRKGDRPVFWPQEVVIAPWNDAHFKNVKRIDKYLTDYGESRYMSRRFYV